jgi:hypothetical protein
MTAETAAFSIPSQVASYGLPAVPRPMASVTPVASVSRSTAPVVGDRVALLKWLYARLHKLQREQRLGRLPPSELVSIEEIRADIDRWEAEGRAPSPIWAELEAVAKAVLAEHKATR